MPEISEPSKPSGLDSSLVPCAQELTSVVVTIQDVIDRLQALAVRSDTTDGIIEDMVTTVNNSPDVQPASIVVPVLMEVSTSSGTQLASVGAPTLDNAPIVPATKWYAVLVGRQPGVFCGPQSIPANTYRIPGANAPRFDTEAEAQHVFDTALDGGFVEKVDLVITREKMTRVHFPTGRYHV
ncbi:hypothetical protein BDN70DRAFT_938081 [Pholiota conissans]|uniref:Ribonuclease H1 N-terminal domain-containing protein n=1 Tax=Pholiota conissans TaxID=109636 RepID=A0A9P6CMR3_9AGAR|nr:hypothetical protein BDN70DRAFT_938081 [Pholiota conissans]